LTVSCSSFGYFDIVCLALRSSKSDIPNDIFLRQLILLKSERNYDGQAISKACSVLLDPKVFAKVQPVVIAIDTWGALYEAGKSSFSLDQWTLLLKALLCGARHPDSHEGRRAAFDVLQCIFKNSAGSFDVTQALLSAVQSTIAELESTRLDAVVESRLRGSLSHALELMCMFAIVPDKREEKFEKLLMELALVANHPIVSFPPNFYEWPGLVNHVSREEKHLDPIGLVKKYGSMMIDKVISEWTSMVCPDHLS
jgi:hypothetical protein